ncbi:MAG: ABC transporter ATP-binding protein [Gammaproteobacteria bacterium]
MSDQSNDAEPALIQARGITRWYGGHCAVSEVSLTLRRGEVLGFLGPNGAGKSTTMRILAGVLAPNAGSVAIAGVDMLDDPRAAKRQLGYLPEHPPLNIELTVDEYLDFCARLHCVPRPEVRERREQAKARCGLEQVGRRLIGNLSKGFQQRVGIAQAIIHQPPVVILDEPTVGLDPIQIREIRALIGELGASHGVILSTHILPEVQSVCERVVIIHRGRVVLDQKLAALDAGGALRIALRRPPPAQALEALAGVVAVDAAGEGRFVVRHVGEDGFAERLAAHAVNAGWGLTEIAPVAASLEEIFVRLTGNEATGEPGQAAA